LSIVEYGACTPVPVWVARMLPVSTPGADASWMPQAVPLESVT
jgi:hypothetical protein